MLKVLDVSTNNSLKSFTGIIEFNIVKSSFKKLTLKS